MTKEQYRLIDGHFQYRANYNFLSIVKKIVERVLDYDEEIQEDAIWQAIDDELIYYDDQWEVLMFYCSPAGADLEKALDYLSQDIWEILIVLGKEVK